MITHNLTVNAIDFVAHITNQMVRLFCQDELVGTIEFCDTFECAFIKLNDGGEDQTSSNMYFEYADRKEEAAHWLAAVSFD
jgi:hypothetical protein